MVGTLGTLVHDGTMSRKAKDKIEIEERIGYTFADKALRDRALTHISALSSKSSRTGSYQRLEFLGDHVLGLVVSDMLFRAFPKADEGELSRRLADLVRTETCAEIARAIDLGDFIRLGSSEANSGGRRRTAILADVCEALIGAVFVDGGYAPAAVLVDRLWSERMRAPARPLRDPKTVLQEWAQARGLPTPSYREVARTGPHHDPNSRLWSNFRRSCRPKGLVAPSARLNRPPQARCCCARASIPPLSSRAKRQDRHAAMDEARPDGAPATRCGFVTLIGAPNVGKSTLLNALVGSKVSIVTPKVQTTRTLVRGIVLEGAAQIIFIDTPGIFVPRRRLDRAMVTTAWGGAHDADIVGVLVDAKRGLDADTAAIFSRLANVAAPKILVINKVDLVDKKSLLALVQSLNEQGVFAATFMVAALSGDGVGDVKIWLAGHVAQGPWHYPEDQISDAPLRSLAAEITREKLFLRLHQELPYQSTVETDIWKDLKDGAVRIEQTIYVARESQRKIVLGKGGQTIKNIGADARKEIADILEQPVHLFLFVKVREGWADDPERYREMGLEFPRD